MMPTMTDADAFAAARTATAAAIEKLKAVSAPVGSSEARMAASALDQLGYAYSLLMPPSDNPAWAA